MAQKRMFTMKIVDSDAFLDMPLSTQCLYFHLNMRADDDGFIGNPKRIQRIIGASEDDFKLLVAKHFILIFDNGVIVIKHWKMHNYIQSDRYVPTQYQEEKSMLYEKKNKSYTLDSHKGIESINNKEAETKCIQNNNDSETECLQNVSTDIDLDIEKDLVKKHIVHESHALFEKLWSLYPLKRGKGQVSNAAKKRLLDIGYDQMERAIYRYKADLEKETWRKPQNGSTFFNSGYEDYLDCNCQDSITEIESETLDRFSVLPEEFRNELKRQGVISGESLSLGNATDKQIKRLQEAGVL